MLWAHQDELGWNIFDLSIVASGVADQTPAWKFGTPVLQGLCCGSQVIRDGDIIIAVAELWGGWCLFCTQWCSTTWRTESKDHLLPTCHVSNTIYYINIIYHIHSFTQMSIHIYMIIWYTKPDSRSSRAYNGMNLVSHQTINLCAVAPSLLWNFHYCENGWC